MAQRNFNRYRGKLPMADMNVVPLVDVMLVLLVIFIVTAPLLTHAVKIDLPKASSRVNVTKPEHIEFGIREDGRLFWSGEQVALDLLPQPEVHIRADRHVHYEKVAQVMAQAAKAGLVRIGFVSDARWRCGRLAAQSLVSPRPVAATRNRVTLAPARSTVPLRYPPPGGSARCPGRQPSASPA